ncbi:hypothetical protein HPB50_000149 [Hyalomma asiaticum]|uniref:Uncharacterized protein n=1 Tax=Hyalomma asiaticum TaxID=266040 RepID=A0ACB7RI88_HYAAI|nr:hypothetical protein HPB50_000149 [Hyalomma asiaticum]
MQEQRVENNNRIVQTIYNSATEALWNKASRRYVSAENVFFSRWWDQQSEDVQGRVKEMVQSGRFQFVGGGWVQNDEAVTHYTAIIDQMTLGLRFLNDTFGPDCGVPSVAWQADPFGHSIAQAALFARTKVYTNDTVAVMSGCDMCYTEAHERFHRQEGVMEKAIPIAEKQRPRVHVVYSTPACYVQAIHEASRTWPRFADDLLPYSDVPGRSWTGFYSTRPNLKMMITYANGFLQEVIRYSLSSLMSLAAKGTVHSERQLHFCHLLNQSECRYTETLREFSVIVYNPASVRVSPYLRLPLGTSDRSGVSVIGPDGARIEYQAKRSRYDNGNPPVDPVRMRGKSKVREEV